LKKRTKKLLIAVADLSGSAPQRRKSLLVLFFRKEHSSARIHKTWTLRRGVMPENDNFIQKTLDQAQLVFNFG
jgi:hypothetical protein